MKKLLAILLALVMLLSLAACGGSDKDDEDEETKDTKKQEIKKPVEGTELKTQLWTLVYDEEAWVYEEDALTDDEDWCKIYMTIPDPEDEDSYLIDAEIYASVESAEDFREMLYNCGFDAYAYAVEEEYDTVSIGGVECLEYETTSWGEDCLRYFGRDEAAGVTVQVELCGDVYDDQVQTLLDGLSFTLEDVGNEDIPWPWDGEAFEAVDTSATVGTKKISAQWIPFEEAVTTFETFNHTIAVAGDTAYVLSDGKLIACAFDGDELVFDQQITLDGEYEYMYADENGVLWLSAFMEDLIGLEDGQEVANYGEKDCVAMAPSGTWGVSWFSGPECGLIELSGGKVSTSDITFDAVETIMHLNVDEEYIYVCGSGDDDEHKVYVYDKNGNLKLTLADENGEGMGSITFVAQVDGGFMGLDGNMREIVLWDEAGNWLGSCEDSDLFGTYYPWFCGGTVLSDGSVLVLMTEDRADESATEVVVFKLTVS